MEKKSQQSKIYGKNMFPLWFPCNMKQWCHDYEQYIMSVWNIETYQDIYQCYSKLKRSISKTRHQKTTVDFIWLWYSIFACTNSISEINSVSNMPFCEIIVVYYNYMVLIFNSILLNHIYFKAIKYLPIYFHS